MALSNYSTLQTAIKNWLDNAELDSYIPDFITLGENDIWEELRVPEMEDITTITSTGQTIGLPSDWVNVRRVDVKQTYYYNIQYVNEETLIRKDDTSSGRPTHFSIIGNNIHLNRPCSGFVFRVSYFKKMASLASTSTNDVLSNHPNLYLYSALKHAAPFLTEDPRIQTWESLYRQHLTIANQSAMNRYSGPIQFENEDRYYE